MKISEYVCVHYEYFFKESGFVWNEQFEIDS